MFLEVFCLSNFFRTSENSRTKFFITSFLLVYSLCIHNRGKHQKTNSKKIRNSRTNIVSSLYSESKNRCVYMTVKLWLISFQTYIPTPNYFFLKYIYVCAVYTNKNLLCNFLFITANKTEKSSPPPTGKSWARHWVYNIAVCCVHLFCTENPDEKNFSPHVPAPIRFHPSFRRRSIFEHNNRSIASKS